jgi:hypothetical protein
MATDSGRALSRVREDVYDEDEQDVEIMDGPAHVLRLGDEEFACKDTLPMGTLVRYADNGLMGIHHVLVKVVIPDEPSAAELRANPDAQPSHERMWDAFEDLDEREVMKAVEGLIESYAARPTQSRSSSRGGRRTTGRR